MKGPLFDHLDELATRLGATGEYALFFDFDGVLVPFQDYPDRVQLDAATRQSLQALARRPGRIVAVVSGRELADLQQRVGLPSLIYAGNHGLEILGNSNAFVEPTALEHRNDLKNLTADLAKRLEGIPGVLIEDKGLTASVHYRATPAERHEEVRRLVHGAMASANHPFQLTPAVQVFDIRPRIYWSKGDAVKWIREHSPAPTAPVIYVGHEIMGSDAFAALPDDITVQVGAAPETQAQYFVSDVAQVHEFLHWLVQQDKSR